MPSASFAFHQIYPEQAMVLDLNARGTIDVKKMVTHRFPIEGINAAIETAQDKERTDVVFVAIELGA